jgi:hypothetical protein
MCSASRALQPWARPAPGKGAGPLHRPPPPALWSLSVPARPRCSSELARPLADASSLPCCPVSGSCCAFRCPPECTRGVAGAPSPSRAWRRCARGRACSSAAFPPACAPSPPSRSCCCTCMRRTRTSSSPPRRRPPRPPPPRPHQGRPPSTDPSLHPAGWTVPPSSMGPPLGAARPVFPMGQGDLTWGHARARPCPRTPSDQGAKERG